MQKSKERAARIKRQPGLLEPKKGVNDDHRLEAEEEREKVTPIMSQRAQRGKSAEMAVQRVRRIDHAILNERSLIRRFHDKLLRIDNEEES